LAQAPLILEGVLPDGGPDFLVLPFEVPAGTQEIEVSHRSVSADDIIDFGLRDPSRFRGWGGGNSEPALVGPAAASRSYLTGALPAGTWGVDVGKAKIVSRPGRYHVEVTLRAAPTLSPQPERRPYQASPALETGARWYAGDLHVHSKESGDASPSIDAVATFARGRGLDFVELSEHNTVSQLDFLGDVQPRHPKLLLLPGVEFTTYFGHANGIGATQYVDHHFGVAGASLDAAVEAFAAQGAVLSINHPVLDLGNNCIGCAWKQAVPKAQLGGVEIGTGGWDKTGLLFTKQAIAWWDRLLAQGLHLAPLGGSDDHSGGTGTGAFDSPIGNPTTMVWAEELSAAGIVEGIRQGRTVVKLQGPGDPMVELTSGPARVGDTLHVAKATLQAVVTGGAGAKLRWVVNGAAEEPVAVSADPFTVSREVAPPATGEDRWRVEVLLDDQPRTVTGHLWIAQPTSDPPRGCGCASGGSGLVALAILLGALVRPRS
jgi:hypothetical protein